MRSRIPDGSWLLVLHIAFLAACEASTGPLVQGAPWVPGAPVPVLVANGAFAIPGQPVPAMTSTGRPAPSPTPTPMPTPIVPPLPNGVTDSQGSMLLSFLQSEAAAMLSETVAVLRPDRHSLVQGIPLQTDTSSNDVNAYAACADSGPFMAITLPLERVIGHLAEAKAADELFHGQQVPAYEQLVVNSLNAQQPIADLPAGFFSATEATDPRKLARERVLYDEEVSFVLGHELAHHYLGHTGCATGAVAGAIDPTVVARITSHVIPGFNQINEVEADTCGTQTTLDAGQALAPSGQGPVLTEEGGLLVMDFFSALQRLTPSVLALGFLQTHPPPQLRAPLIQSTAQQWRMGIGRSGATAIPLPIPIPIFGQ